MGRLGNWLPSTPRLGNWLGNRLVGLPVRSGGAAFPPWDNIVHLVTGPSQSNQLVRNTGSYTLNPNVKILNSSTANLETWNPANATPQHEISDPGIGSSGALQNCYPIVWHLADAIATTYNCEVRVICVAWGGIEIESFRSPTGPMYLEMVDQLADGLKYFPRIDCVCQHQGETDGGDADYFTVDLPDVQATWRGFSQGWASLPWIMGELEDRRTTQNAAFQAYAASALNTACASSSGLAISDETHFTDAAARTFGYERYFALFQNYLQVIAQGATGAAPNNAVSDLAAVVDSDSEISLTWTDSTDASVTSYKVQYDSGSGWTEVVLLDVGVEAYTVEGLTGDTEYDFRVVAQNKYGAAASNVETATTDETPSATLPTTNLVSQWAADLGVFTDVSETVPATNGEGARRWADQVAGVNSLGQPTAGSQPTLVTGAQNSLPVLRFDGSADFLYKGSAPSVTGTPFTLYIAGKHDTPTSFGALASLTNAGSSNQYFVFGLGGSQESAVMLQRDSATQYTSYSTTPPTVQTATMCDATMVSTSSSSRAIYFNGSNSATNTDTVAPSISEFSIGANRGSSVGNYFNGDICEVLLYSAAHNPTQQAEVRAYLKAKWGY